jgi:hypothetical protein
VAVDADAEPLGQVGNRPLKPGVVERDEPAAPLTDEVVVMMAIGKHPLEPRLPVTDRNPFDEAMLDEQVKHAINARAARGAGGAALRPQRILDLDGAERARLRREQLNHPVARPAALQTGLREDRVNMLVPTIRRHRAQD